MADYEALLNAEKKKHVPAPTSVSQEVKAVPEKKDQPKTQSAHRLTDQSTRQSMSRSTKQSTPQSDHKIVEKPKGFYITQRLDKKLDEAVRYMREIHAIKKADRSTIVNAILDNEANWKEESLDLLVERVITLLTSRLMG